MKKRIEEILFAFLGWLILISRWGYIYGENDQQELLPYVLHLKNTALYSSDFFIKSLASIVPNERFLFAYSMLPFECFLQLFCLVAHILFTVLLLIGMYRVANLCIQNSLLSWAVVYLNLTVFYLKGLGGVDAYYNLFQASNVAKAIAIWAIYSVLQKKYVWSIILLILATLAQQPLGLNLFILLSGAILLFSLEKKDMYTLKKWSVLSLVYLCTAGIYIVFMLYARKENTQISNDVVFKILYEFRHPHHFLMQSFSWFQIVFFYSIITVALGYFFSKNKLMFYMILFGLISTIIYTVLLEKYHAVFIGNLNWYKNTIWLKFMGLVALTAIFKNLLQVNIRTSKKQYYVLLISLIFGGCIYVFSTSKTYFKEPIQISKKAFNNDEILISKAAKENTKTDAVFLLPFGATYFKYWSQRASYVDFKANVRTPTGCVEWYRRVHEVYGIDTSSSVKGFELEKQADSFYYAQNEAFFNTFKNLGVTYILTKNNQLSFQKIAENKTYSLYKL